jgi:flagellar basal body-associated protein FliL
VLLLVVVAILAAVLMLAVMWLQGQAEHETMARFLVRRP